MSDCIFRGPRRMYARTRERASLGSEDLISFFGDTSEVSFLRYHIPILLHILVWYLML